MTIVVIPHRRLVEDTNHREIPWNWGFAGFTLMWFGMLCMVSRTFFLHPFRNNMLITCTTAACGFWPWLRSLDANTEVDFEDMAARRLWDWLGMVDWDRTCYWRKLDLFFFLLYIIVFFFFYLTFFFYLYISYLFLSFLVRLKRLELFGESNVISSGKQCMKHLWW